MTQMNADVSHLSAAAKKFESIASDLGAAVSAVNQTAAELHPGWQGSAGAAAVKALADFETAANRQFKALEGISRAIGDSGHHYGSVDEDHAGSLAAAMKF